MKWNRLGLAICLLAGVAALWLSYNHVGAPYLSNDGYQYLDAASNIASGNCLCTQLAHFDEQVAFGRLPVPFTHFPPGYSILIAAVSRLGVSLEVAGYLVSAAGYLVVIWMIWDIGLGLGASAWMLGSFSLLWIVQVDALTYAAMIGTEMSFTALIMVLVALIMRDLLSEGRRSFLLVAIGTAAGFLFWLRYAGLFLIPVAGAYIVWRWWRNRNTLWALAGLACTGLLTTVPMVRNAVYTSSWRGGFTTGNTHRSLRKVMVETAKAFSHCIWGPCSGAVRHLVGATSWCLWRP